MTPAGSTAHAEHFADKAETCEQSQLTLSSMLSIPMAFQISTKYLPVTWIFFRSPDILLFIWAKMSATLQVTHCHCCNCPKIPVFCLKLSNTSCCLVKIAADLDRDIPEFEGHTTLGQFVHIQRFHDPLRSGRNSVYRKARLMELSAKPCMQSCACTNKFTVLPCMSCLWGAGHVLT